MATKDSGKRGSRQPAPRGRDRTNAETGAPPAAPPAASESTGAGAGGATPGTRRRTRGAAEGGRAAEPRATPERRTRRPVHPESAGVEPPAEPAAQRVAAEEGAAGGALPPVPTTAAPEAAASGSVVPLAATLPDESLPPTELKSEVTGYDLPPTEAPPEAAGIQPEVPNAELAEAMRDEERDAALIGLPAAATAAPRTGRRERSRVSHSNALGMLIERHFGDPMSPCRSYSDLERRSGISREALSRYVTSRVDRRRSPTIDTLVAIADAMHLSLESVCRAAAASVKGMPLAADEEQHEREEVLSALVGGLTDQQFSAVVELLRHLRPVVSTSER